MRPKPSLVTISIITHMTCARHCAERERENLKPSSYPSIEAGQDGFGVRWSWVEILGHYFLSVWSWANCSSSQNLCREKITSYELVFNQIKYIQHLGDSLAQRRFTRVLILFIHSAKLLPSCFADENGDLWDIRGLAQNHREHRQEWN